MIKKHAEYTGSTLAQDILAQWDSNVSRFVKVMPKDYSRMLQAIRTVEKAGLSGEEALMAAFAENNRDVARVSGN